jgi:hypothetical protein
MIKPMLRLVTLSMFVWGTVARAQSVTAAPQADRTALEQQFRERTAKLVQQRLGLNDAQLAKLEQSNARFAPQLRQLATQERDIRFQLRQEMMAGNSANQQHVSDLLDAAIRMQRQRLGIVEAEQKELAGFLTPVQRARYMALQAQFGKRAQELSGQGGKQKQGLGLRRRPIGRLP